MKLVLSVVLVMALALFLVSCGEEEEENIYENITNDKSNEDPDETPDYQTRPDTNDIEINDDFSDENVSDPDVSDEDATDITNDMILIPQGKAWIGCNENIETDCPLSELPYHEVSMKSYFIDKYEVTVADFQKCIDAGGCGAEDDTYKTRNGNPYCNIGATGKEQHPVNCVNWVGANEYCVWAGKRLPSEGEWEKAARGGCEIHGEEDCEAVSFIYTWGNEGTPDCSKVNMAESATSWGCGSDSTTIGGSYAASDSPYGVADMLGNLYEWVSDKWIGNHDLAKPDGSSAGVPNDEAVIKGGGFIQDNVTQFRVNYRVGKETNEILNSQGFRCAADVE